MLYVNTYRLDSRPTWEMEALAAHELLPGHHLQVALSQELEGLPEFRRYGGYAALTRAGRCMPSDSVATSASTAIRLTVGQLS